MRAVEGGRTKIVIVDVTNGSILTDLSGDELDQWTALKALVRVEGRPVGMLAVEGGTDERSLADTLRAAVATLPLPARAPWAGVVPSSWPPVRVAISSMFTRPELLRRTVEHVTEVDYPDLEIVVVDNRLHPNVHDHDALRHAAYRTINIVHEPARGIAAARNRALEDCERPFIAFTDDDTQVERDWLYHLMMPFLADCSVACVSGIVVPDELTSSEQNQFEQLFEGFNRSYAPHLYGGAADESDPLYPYAPGKLGTGANMAFSVPWLRSLGGFNPALGTGTAARGGEDLAVFIKTVLGGGSIAYEPSAIVRHCYSATPAEFKKEVFNYGAGLGAMYMALMMESRQCRRDIIRLLPKALMLYLRSGNCTVHKTSDEPPAPLSWRLRHASGMLLGPFLYLVSRRQLGARAR